LCLASLGGEMGFINSLIGRRQFLVASAASVAALTLEKLTKGLGLASSFATEKPDSQGKRALRGCVVYYSATGSTGKVAGAIHRGMKKVMECDIAPLKKLDPKKMAKYDVIAIGGPIWYFRETANLRNYAYNMPDMSGKLCIPFCTHGTNPDGFFYSLSTQLLKKGLKIIGWNDWYGGCSHVLHQPSPYFTDGHPDEIDLKEAEAFGKEMAERAQKIYAGDKSLIPEIPAGADADSLWMPQGFGDGRGMGNGVPGGGSGSALSGGATSANGPGGQMPGAGPAAAGMVVGGAAVAGGTPGSMSGGGQSGMPGGARGAVPGGMPGPGAAGGKTAGANGAAGGAAPRGMPGNANAATMTPAIDLTKCVYPRCRTCMDVCVVDAIDLSLLSAQPADVSETKFLVRQACLHCAHPLCEKGCSYDAITCDNGTKTEHVFDMKKCIYPKCTLCIDNCPMDAIDFTQNPPHIKRNCEGCDVCWCVCPKDAISIPNIATTHARLTPSSAEDGFFAALNAAEKTGRFRRLVPLDKIGWDHIVYKNPNAPRVVLHEENYPYEVKGA
jgi:flavodoxin/ferredoxin